LLLVTSTGEAPAAPVQTLGHEIKEAVHVGRDILTVLIDGVDRAVGAGKLAQPRDDAQGLSDDRYA
jgi:hypothetical protein